MSFCEGPLSCAGTAPFLPPQAIATKLTSTAAVKILVLTLLLAIFRSYDLESVSVFLSLLRLHALPHCVSKFSYLLRKSQLTWRAHVNQLHLQLVSDITLRASITFTTAVHVCTETYPAQEVLLFGYL